MKQKPVSLGEIRNIIQYALIPQYERQLNDYKEDLKNDSDHLGYMYAKGAINVKREDLYNLQKILEQLQEIK